MTRIQNADMSLCVRRLASLSESYLEATTRAAAPEEHLGGVRGEVRGTEADVGGPLALLRELHVVVEQQVRHHRLDLVRGEEPPGAACARGCQRPWRKTEV